MKGRRYKLWWSGKGDGVGGVVVMVKDELCENALEVRIISDTLITVVVVIDKDVLKLIYGYAPQIGRRLK